MHEYQLQPELEVDFLVHFGCFCHVALCVCVCVCVRACVCSTNHYSEHVIDHTELPRQLIKSALGEYLLQQTQPKVHSHTHTHTHTHTQIDDNRLNDFGGTDCLLMF